MSLRLSLNLLRKTFQTLLPGTSIGGNEFICSNCLLLNGSKTHREQEKFIVQYSSSSGEANVPVITYEELKKLTKSPDVLLIDVSDPNELQPTGQIPMSINIPIGQLVKVLSFNFLPDDFKNKYDREKPHRSSEIVFLCRSGNKAEYAAKVAKKLGYENIKSYVGFWEERS